MLPNVMTTNAWQIGTKIYRKNYVWHSALEKNTKATKMVTDELLKMHLGREKNLPFTEPFTRHDF